MYTDMTFATVWCVVQQLLPVYDTTAHLTPGDTGALVTCCAAGAGNHGSGPDALAAAQPLAAPTCGHLTEMAAAGHRTLVVATRNLQQQEYDAWASRYKAACSSMGDRVAEVASVCEDMETNLVLLGATAVEDKLQVCVEGTMGL